MFLWLIFALLTAAVLAALLRPLLRPAPGAPAGAANVAVYRDQLAEIERERESGLLGGAEATAAHAEVARRLLASTETPTHSRSTPARATHAATAALILAVASPLLAAGAYLLLGAPGLPGAPLSARIAAAVDPSRVDDLVAKVEARLREHPDDGQGWEVIAPVYFKQERYKDAADAYARAIALLGESARRLAGFAEATTLAGDGIVTEPARKAYEKLAALEPSRVEPRFWLAVANEQDGRLAEAGEAYQRLLQGGDPAAEWRPVVEQRLEDVKMRLASAGQAQGSTGAAREPSTGPTADDIKASAALSPEERAKFIEQMVSGLAARLKQDGSDLAGWQKLIRAYAVLSRRNEAQGALADARRNFEGNTASLDILDALAKSLGLGS